VHICKASAADIRLLSVARKVGRRNKYKKRTPGGQAPPPPPAGTYEHLSGAELPGGTITACTQLVLVSSLDYDQFRPWSCVSQEVRYFKMNSRNDGLIVNPAKSGSSIF
jgi:hypothetical protein